MISKTCGYAIRALVYLAMKSSESYKVGIQELAQELDVPQAFLSKIMQGLVRRGILSSTKGPNGGFHANELTLQTPIIEVVNAIDGMGAFRRCLLGLPKCSAEKPCPLHSHVVDFRNSLLESLQTLIVQNMVEDVAGGLSVLQQVKSH